MAPIKSSIVAASALFVAVVPGALSFSVQRSNKIQAAAPLVSVQQQQQHQQRRQGTAKTALHLFDTKEKTKDAEATETAPSIDETTEKYGLEAGLFQSLKSDDGGASAKDLLAKYGVAYLATSIPLALVSFTLCYFLVDNGVDVAALLSKVGIDVGDAGEKAGTVAIAYAAHKAASPIRFPPTVILTPVVAKLIGKEPNEEAAAE